MVIRNYHWLNSASRVLISTCCAPLVQTGEHKQFSLFDLDLWPTTLTYDPRLAKVKVNPHAKYQDQRSNGSNRRAPTDKRTDTRTLSNVLSPLLRGRCYLLRTGVHRIVVNEDRPLLLIQNVMSKGFFHTDPASNCTVQHCTRDHVSPPTHQIRRRAATVSYRITSCRAGSDVKDP